MKDKKTEDRILYYWKRRKLGTELLKYSVLRFLLLHQNKDSNKFSLPINYYFPFLWFFQSKFSGKSKKAAEGKDEVEDPDLDLSIELKPIGDYIKDREEMLEQMFACIQADKLTTMMPSVLQVKCKVLGR